MRVPQPPQPDERQGKHRRPAQQPVLAVEEESHQSIAALEVASRRAGVGCTVARTIRGVRRRAAVERLVEGHIEGNREQRELDGSHRQRPAPRTPERPHRHGADHHARGHELRAEPRQRAEQRKAGERVRPRHPLPEAQRQQRGARERRTRRELRIDGAAVCQERRAEPDGDGSAQRPRVGCHSQREPVRQRPRKRRDRREEELDGLRATDRVRGRDEQRKPDAVRLVQPALGRPAVATKLVRIEVGVRALRVLVPHVHIAVLDDRLGGQQIVRLIAAVVRGPEGAQAQRGGVGGEEQQPEGEGATHRRRTLAADR